MPEKFSYELRKIINGKGYLGFIEGEIIDSIKSRFPELNIVFDPEIGKEWEIPIIAGAHFFLDYLHKNGKSLKLNLKITEMRGLPIDTTYSIIMYVTLKALSEYFKFDIDKYAYFNEKNGEFCLKK
jgi:hypothetical protein